ncbi:MAG: hypothetical protein FI707_06995 [SAR202 cluster bacterium]|nr:hypothetical protein [Chloroflexota bacterium]MDP6422901.1 hypothetical protein [SAR202 cluster bacterium]HAL46939.1 hypothetical protein [Dehalococcoidia bacterium]MDP6665479.1 hypothetical protein [SAR202 cluster bacterium]MDP6798273.1 hypothetical protein [SAR202 cluster bacterium]
MEYWIALAIRSGIGVIFGILFGFVGLMITFAVVPGYYTPPLWMLVLTTALGASIAGFLAFYKPDVPWRIAARGFALALIGGFIGGWIGYWYAQTFYPDGVRNVMLVARSVKSPAITPFISSAAIGSTGVGAVYYAIRAWRYHEV